jgi:hypothetical protein
MGTEGEIGPVIGIHKASICMSKHWGGANDILETKFMVVIIRFCSIIGAYE